MGGDYVTYRENTMLFSVREGYLCVGGSRQHVRMEADFTSYEGTTTTRFTIVIGDVADGFAFADFAFFCFYVF